MIRVWGESDASYAARVSMRVAEDSAMDAPFYSLKREKALERQAAATAARVSAPRLPLGFTSNRTSATPSSADLIPVDAQKKRIKRMRTGVQHAARLLEFAATEGGARVNRKFLTLTYRGADDWSPKHIATFRNRLYAWCKRRGIHCRFVWVAELQKRGVIHYHMVVWLPKGHLIPTPDASGWWPHGRTNIVDAHSPIGYISKYASKSTVDHAAAFPKGARMHGAGGLDDEQKRHLRYWQSPFWVRDALTGRADIRKVRGGYADKATGEFLASPWAIMVDRAGRVFAYRKTFL